MPEKEEKSREGQLRRRRNAEQVSIFLALFILFLGIVFLTREREAFLKSMILTGLGTALNGCIAIEFYLRDKWLITMITTVAAATGALALVLQIFIA